MIEKKTNLLVNHAENNNWAVKYYIVRYLSMFKYVLEGDIKSRLIYKL